MIDGGALWCCFVIMAKSFSVNKRLSGAYVISVETVRQLHRVVERFTGKTASVSFSMQGGRSTQSEDLNEVITDSFVETEELRSIKLYARNYDLENDDLRSCDVTLTNSVLDPISIQMIGDRSEIVTAEKDFENIISPSKAWYSFAVSGFLGSFIPFLSGLALGIIFLFMGLLAYLPHGSVPTSNEVYVGAAVACVLSFAMVAQIAKGFPKILFDFGYSGRRIRFRMLVAKFIFSVVLVGLVVGVVGNFLTDFIRAMFSKG